MKRLFSVCIAGTALLCGCSTNSVITGPTANAAIQAAAYDGTLGALMYNSSYRPGFIMATNVLSNVNPTNLTSPTAIENILSGLNVGGKNATYVPLYLQSVFVNLNAFGVNFQSLQSTNAPAALTALSGYQQAVVAGIAMALAVTQPVAP